MFFVCLLAQLLLRSQLCNLIICNKIFRESSQYLYFESCRHTCTRQNMHILYCLARAGRPTKLCQWFRVTRPLDIKSNIWVAMSKYTQSDVKRNIRHQVHVLAYKVFFFNEQQRMIHFTRRAATRLTFKDSMTNIKCKASSTTCFSITMWCTHVALHMYPQVLFTNFLLYYLHLSLAI